MDDLYRQVILDRYKNPVNLGQINNALVVEDVNPLCGDRIKIWLDIKNKIVVDAKFQGSGCAISIAATDILIDLIKGKHINQVLSLSGTEIESELDIQLTSVRKRCAYIGLEAIKKLKNSLTNL
jgi:nitrogen fixation NifU-like protein